MKNASMLKKVLLYTIVVLLLTDQIAAASDNEGYFTRFSGWMTNVKQVIVDKINEWRGLKKDQAVAEEPQNRQNPGQPRSPVTTVDAKTPEKAMEESRDSAASRTTQEPSFTLAPIVRKGRELVVDPVQSQPALAVNKSMPAVRLSSIPEYKTKPLKPVPLLEAAGAQLAPVSKSVRAKELAAVKEASINPDWIRQISKLLAMNANPIVKIESLSRDAMEMVLGLFHWLLEPEMKEADLASLETEMPKSDKTLSILHRLALSSKLPAIRQKCFAFNGWILDEKNYSGLATLAFARSLENSSFSAENASYDNAVASELSRLAPKTSLSKSWFLSLKNFKPTVARALESKGLKPEAQAFLTLLAAEAAFDADHFAAARKLAQAIPAKTRWKEHGRYLAAVSAFAVKDSKENYELAGRELTELFRTVDSPEVFDATAVSLGRIHFGLGNYKAAHQYLSQVTRETNIFIEAAIDNAWALLRSGDQNHAVGNMFTLHTSYFDGAYMPDSFFLKSLGYQEICQFGDAMNAVKEYKLRYNESFKKTADFNKANKGSDAAYYSDLVAYLSKQDHKLSGLVLRELGRHPEFLRRQKELNLLSKERRLISKRFTVAGPSLADWATPYDAELKNDHQKTIAKFLKDRTLAIEEELKFVTANMSLMEYEIFAGAGQNLALQGAQNFAIDDKAQPKRDFEEGKEYWPYEDEIWEDELNNFRSKIVDGCAKVRKPAQSG